MRHDPSIKIMMDIFLEDLIQGFENQVGGYSLTKEDIISFAKQWDPMPYHIDEHIAESSIFKGLTASSCHIVAICTLLYHRSDNKIKILAMLGKDELRFPNPARVNDVLCYQSTCESARHSKKNPKQGIAVLKEQIINQDKEVIMSQKVTVLVQSKNALA